MSMLKAGINSIRENWNLNYSAAFVTCSLVNRTSKVHLGCPHTVSIIHPMDRSVNRTQNRLISPREDVVVLSLACYERLI